MITTRGSRLAAARAVAASGPRDAAARAAAAPPSRTSAPDSRPPYRRRIRPHRHRARQPRVRPGRWWPRRCHSRSGGRSRGRPAHAASARAAGDDPNSMATPHPYHNGHAESARSLQPRRQGRRGDRRVLRPGGRVRRRPRAGGRRSRPRRPPRRPARLHPGHGHLPRPEGDRGDGRRVVTGRLPGAGRRGHRRRSAGSGPSSWTTPASSSAAPGHPRDPRGLRPRDQPSTSTGCSTGWPRPAAG